MHDIHAAADANEPLTDVGPPPDDLAIAFADGLQRLAGMRGAWTAPALTQVRLHEQTQRLEDPDAVRLALERFAAQPGCCGWIETPQVLRAVGAGHAVPAAGTPLHAELACGDASLQLRWADGAWLLTLLDEGHADGLACWAQDVERLANLPGVTRWQYRVFLRADGEGSLQPFAARLAGAEG